MNHLYLFAVAVLLFLVGCAESSPWDRTYRAASLEADMKLLQEDEDSPLMDVATLAAYIMEKQWTDKSLLKGRTYRQLLKEAKENGGGIGGAVKPLINMGQEIGKSIHDFIKQNSPQDVKTHMGSNERIGESLIEELKNSKQQGSQDVTATLEKMVQAMKHAQDENPQMDKMMDIFNGMMKDMDLIKPGTLDTMMKQAEDKMK